MHKPVLITFSGLDGSGKSTQIERLRSFLAAHGLSIQSLAFWDDVVVLTRYRETFVHKVYKSEQGIGSPDKPVNRQDKNVRRWYLTIIRHMLYFLDALNLLIVVARARQSGSSAIVMDRYIYDELANLPLANPFSRVFVRLLALLVPTPDVALLLDVEPEAAVQRKPEYPVDFLHQNRRSYHALAQILGNLILIPPLSPTEAHQMIVSNVEHKFSLNDEATQPGRVTSGKAA